MLHFAASDLSQLWQFPFLIHNVLSVKVKSFSEKGQFLTLDLWGNHFRVLLVTINGHDPLDVESSQGLIPTKILEGTGEAVGKLMRWMY